MSSPHLPFSGDIPLSEYLEQVHDAIEALPFREPILLMFESCSPAVGVAWAVRSKLVGLCVINFMGYFDEDFVGSTAHKRHTMGCGNMDKAVRESNYANGPLKNLPGMGLHVTDISVMTDFKEKFIKEIQAANAGCDFGAMSATFLKYTPTKLMEDMRERQPLQALPTTILCSAYGMGVNVQESTRRLQKQRLPGSTLSYIPDSKLLWGLEGADQREFVVDAVSKLVKEVLGNTT